MYIKQATVNNQVGLHARPATFFIQKANEFKSTIWVEKDDQRVNAKSLLGVLSLGIIKGSTIDLIADGTDEKEAVDALVELISSDFADGFWQETGLLHFPGKHHRRRRMDFSVGNQQEKRRICGAFCTLWERGWGRRPLKH